MNETKLYRTLMRVIEVDEAKGCFYVIIPGWYPELPVMIRFSNVEDTIKQLVLEGNKYFHARVNLGASESCDLLFTDWETE